MAGWTRRLLWPLVVMLSVSVTLQGISLVAVLEIEEVAAQERPQAALAESQRALVEQFENATYLAVVGLATSDWELLLRQRAAAKEAGKRFEAINAAMLEGGRVREGDTEVTVARVEEPALRAVLTDAPRLWAEAQAAHVRVLRSESRSLKQNPDLEQFNAASMKLTEVLGRLSILLQRRAQAETARLSRLQSLIPVSALLVTLAIFGYVLKRLLLPFAASTEELARSEAALREAHGSLEVRVRERTQELRETQRRAVELARQAGMSELATNVLHNVGNVLNSLNTSSTLLGERLKALRVDALVKLAATFEEGKGDRAGSSTADDRGRRVAEYLGKLGQHLTTERSELLEQTAALQRHVEHIRMIIEVQQTYATTSTIVEATSLEELIDDALRISAPALGRHGITIERHTVPLQRVMLDKHRLLQILLNLISNAKYAMDVKPAGQRSLTVRVDRPQKDRIRLQVIDNGMGIAPELLTKIFQHGFTTRKEGHGFGLHSCAVAANALGGTLVAHSEGPGSGATFTLELPYRPEAAEGA